MNKENDEDVVSTCLVLFWDKGVVSYGSKDGRGIDGCVGRV